MKKSALSDLGQVAEALYRRDFEKMRPILEHEARIRSQLARLDAQAAQARTMTGQSPRYRSVGADLLWHGWENRARRDLNMNLARVRAQKLAAMDNLRDAFGRQQAVAALIDKAHAMSKQDRQKRLISSLLQPATR